MELFVAIWFVVHFFLIYLPVDFQIHLLLGWQIPIAVLASTTIVKHIIPWLKRRQIVVKTLFATCLISLLVANNVYLQIWRYVYLARYEAPNFISTDEEQALLWLDQHVTRSDVVLAALDFGQFVPARSDAHAFLAHWAGTLQYFDKQAMVAQVFNVDTADHVRREIFSKYAVTYVVVREVDLDRSVFVERAGSYLSPVFEQGNVTIYHIDLGALSSNASRNFP